MRLYCGIDQGKEKSSICIINRDKKILLQKTIKNNMADILCLLKEFGPPRDIHSVVESSAYWYWLVDGLTEAGYKVTLAHTFGLSLISKAKVKTDRRDARKLAGLLLGGFIPPAYAYPKEQRSLRDLARHRQTLVRKRTRSWTELNLILARSGKNFSRNGLKDITQRWLEENIENACLRMQCEDILGQVTLYEAQIERAEESIRGLLTASNLNKTAHNLLELPGVWTILAPIIILEIGDIGRFQNARKFSSYCRVIPGIAQSGKVSSRGRGSNQGNPYLKYAFMQAAVAAVRSCKHVRDYYEAQLKKHAAKGGKMICYNIIAHKLALATYAMLKNKQKYDPQKLFGIAA